MDATDPAALKNPGFPPYLRRRFEAIGPSLSGPGSSDLPGSARGPAGWKRGSQGFSRSARRAPGCRDDEPTTRGPGGTATTVVAALLMFLFLCLFLGSGLAAQGPHRIGLLSWSEPGCQNAALRAGLTDLGYVIGESLVIECRHANEDYGRFPAAAEELKRADVQVIVALSHRAATAAQAATDAIPIVMVASGDPVSAGLVGRLAQPGGNVTGMSYYAIELTAKRLELIGELVPGARRIAVLANPDAPDLNIFYLRDAHAAARSLGLTLFVVEARNELEFEGAFRDIRDEGVDALLILPDLLFSTHAAELAALATGYGIPAMHYSARFAVAGGLVAYGADYAQMHYRTATYVDRILRGESPSAMPVEQPRLFELVLNLSTADTLDLDVPHSVLLRADHVVR